LSGLVGYCSDTQAAKGASEVGGTLRLALPAAMGRRWLGPMLPDFLELYPHVSILADYNERLVDIIDEGFDAANGSENWKTIG
jgi:DNA-binding transcriptional LysR family regulator